MQVAEIFAMSNEEIESMRTPNDVIPDLLSGGLSGGLSYGLSDASFLMF